MPYDVAAANDGRARCPSPLNSGVFTSFAYPFANFFQPGVYWPQLAEYKPLQVIAALALLATLGRKATYDRTAALRHPATKWLLAFLFVQAISVYRAGFSTVLSEFGYWFTYALFVLVSLRIITDAGALRRYIWGMMCGSIWLVLWGIYAVFAGLDIGNGGRAGAYGMYENHNDYTFVIVQALPFFYVFWRSETGALKRLILLAGLLACILGVFLSLSRGGILALVLEFALIAIFTMKPRTRLYMLPLIAALGAAAISYQYLKRAQNQGDSYTAADAEASRFELWQAGAEMIKAHPFLGIGSRTFGEFANDYGEISHDNLGKNSHNTYIEVAATTGLFGLICFIGMLRRTIRELRGPPPGPAEPWEEQARKATLIAFYATCFRAFFDAKSWDWSFYVLVVITVASAAILRSRPRVPDAVTDAAPDTPPGLPPTNHLPART